LNFAIKETILSTLKGNNSYKNMKKNIILESIWKWLIT
jgi:hypothetical protein